MFAKARLLQGAIVSITLFFLSCSTDEQKVTVLYNVDSLFNTQIGYLLGHEAAISKKAVLNGVEKITTINPKDSLAWNQELAIFFELDVVNKPMHKGVYEVEEYADNKSNLRVKAFTTTEDLPVRFLKVYYHKSFRQLRKIEAQYNEANSLYSSKRFLTMEFENVYDKTILTSYSIAGGQKMFMDDSVQYNIDANIVLKK